MSVSSGFVPARYILAILGSVGMAIVYGLKVNLSVAMVIMVNSTALKLESLESDQLSCQNSLAELRQSLPSPFPNQTSVFLNETTLREQIAKTSEHCYEIADGIRNLTEKKYTESDLNEVNMFIRNRAKNRFENMSNPFG